MGLLGLLVLVGCHSAYVEATLVNRSGKEISLVELDYPSASFGTQALADGQSFKYRFKVLGTGAVKLIFTDAARQEKDLTGPELKEGDEGRLTVTVRPDGSAGWEQALTNGRGK